MLLPSALLGKFGDNMSVIKLEYNAARQFICPGCGEPLRRKEGGAVRIENGRVDMSVTLPKYICDHCGVYYQEVLRSGYYDVFPLENRDQQAPAASEKTKKQRKRLLRTGDLEPMKLERGADGKCVCPRCGERMDYVEGQPVRLVDGKPDMENVKDHFRCPYCHSVYRRIATTDYFQWSEK